MAKRRSRFSRLKRYARRGTNTSTPFGVILPAVAYGAVRKYTSDALAPLTAKIPLGTYADEALLGTIGYFMAKKGSGMIRSAGMAILTVEAASIGNQVVSGMGSTSSNTVSSSYVYGL